MRLIDIIAYTGTVIGIGGIAGAIETGTSPVSAVVAFAIGAGLMILEERRTRQSEEKSNFLSAGDRDPAVCGTFRKGRRRRARAI